MRTPRIGILCSAGGSSFFAAASILCATGVRRAQDFHLITDRACDAESRAREAGLTHERVVDADRRSFSARAAAALREQQCERLLLFFSRIVSEELFGAVPTWNVHPSLLPAFPGMSAIRDTCKARSAFQGATLHVTTAGCDAGPIVAQVVTPTAPALGIEARRRLAFVQQTYLTLVAVELADRGASGTDDEHVGIGPSADARRTWSASPALRSPALVEGFLRFQRELGTEGLLP